MLNNSGPKIKPWGILNINSSHELYEAFILGLHFLQHSYLCISFDTDRLSPYACNFAMIRSCRRQSNTFKRFVKRAQTVFPLSRDFFYFHN